MSTSAISSTNGYITLCELGNAAQVCKQWSEVFSANAIWMPRFTELFPYNDWKFTAEGEAKSVVLSCLKNEQSRVNEILSLVKTDKQLASIIGPSSPPLNDLRQMPPIERTWHMMKELGKDSTGLQNFLLNLPKKA